MPYIGPSVAQLILCAPLHPSRTNKRQKVASCAKRSYQNMAASVIRRWRCCLEVVAFLPPQVNKAPQTEGSEMELPVEPERESLLMVATQP